MSVSHRSSGSLIVAGRWCGWLLALLVVGGTGLSVRAQDPAAPATSSLFGAVPADARNAYEAAAIRLWAGQAPEARGTASEDVPLLYPVLPAPGASQPRPVMLVIPGGGYTYHSASEAFPIAERFRDAGFAAFVLKYRLQPYAPSDALGDGQRALRVLRSRSTELNIDPHRIAVIGYSAGGHLAANLSTHGDDGQPTAEDPVERLGCRLQTAVLFYPAILHAPAAQLASGVTDLPSLLERDGLQRFVDAHTPPTFMLVGYDDTRAPYAHCLAYAARLHRAGVRFELHVLGDGDHGRSVRDGRRAEWEPLLQHWLTTVGLRPR